MEFSPLGYKTMFSLALSFLLPLIIAMGVGNSATFTCIQDEKTGILTCEFPKSIEDSLKKISDATTNISQTTTEISSKTPTDLTKSTNDILQKTTSIEEICKQSYSVVKNESKKIRNIDVGGTEYSINETSNYTIFAEVPNVYDAVCQYKVFNTTRHLVRNELLSYVPDSLGLYDADFQNPNGNNPIVAGVYMTEVSCIRPLASENQTMYFRYVAYPPTPPAILTDHWLMNSSGTASDYEILTNVGTTEVCIDSLVEFYEYPNDFLPRPNFINFINGIELYMRTASGNTSTANITLKIYKYNFLFGTYTLLNTSTLSSTIMNTTIQKYSLPAMQIQKAFSDSDGLVAEVCAVSGTTRTMRFYHSSATEQSKIVREIGSYNESVSFEYRGASEIHINSPISVSLGNVSLGNITVTADVNYTYFNEKFSGINSTMTSYYNTLNSILLSVNSTVNYLYDWFEYRMAWVS